MSLLINIIKNDLKLIFRDKSLIIIFIVPIAMILICRFEIIKLPEIVPEITNYYWLIITCFAMISTITPSYFFSFILLDEKDENIDLVFRILPVSANFIIKIRIAISMLLGFIFSVIILSLNGLIHLSIFQVIINSLLFSMLPPISTFAITAFSKNKIEAALLYKAMNIIVFIPVIAFFINDNFKYIFGVIPFLWIFETIRLSIQESQIIITLLLAIFTNIALALILFKIYKRKNF